MQNYYEQIEVKDKTTIEALNAIINTINYDTTKVMKELYKPQTTKQYALERVSEDALREIKDNDRTVATLDCNLYKFDNIKFNFLNKIIAQHIKDKNVTAMGISGRIWYPVYGFMGWHTNSNSEGLRLYCSYAKESNKSFFRYCHPDTNEIITSWDDEGWNFRIFKISGKHLWHSVYSETDRFSIGYTLKL
jgi:hypothetical protein